MFKPTRGILSFCSPMIHHVIAAEVSSIQHCLDVWHVAGRPALIVRLTRFDCILCYADIQ